tara:strand:+ start:294 stop:632 length:339 start_codon:yes stop_codon:yes gene_type:complete
MIKKYNQIFIFIVLSLLISSCNTVKKAFDPERKNSSEEFLVEKKSPLSMPPEFDKLPVPQSIVQENPDQSKDIKELITKKNLDQKELDETNNLDKSFEDILLDKINKINVNK